MLRFVHLSDIHFSNRGSKIGFDPDGELRSRMLADIKTKMAELGPATAILVSGDIAYAGQRSEYEDAATWLDDVCDAALCDRAQVRVCPGNHDIDQGVIKENPLIQDGHDAVRRETAAYDRESALDRRLRQSAVSAMFYAPLAAYNNFAARYESSFFADEESFALDNDFPLNDGSTLRLRSLNSAGREQ
jgi:3',5'-cyclic AMP phosphodiesterase CpdA